MHRASNASIRNPRCYYAAWILFILFILNFYAAFDDGEGLAAAVGVGLGEAVGVGLAVGVGAGDAVAVGDGEGVASDVGSCATSAVSSGIGAGLPL